MQRSSRKQLPRNSLRNETRKRSGRRARRQPESIHFLFLAECCFALRLFLLNRSWGYTFLSDGWWSLMRPSSSHLTTASSSLACSTVPNSPVGLPKLPKPSTRSPGFSSWPDADGSESVGFLARSESGVAPAYARG